MVLLQSLTQVLVDSSAHGVDPDVLQAVTQVLVEETSANVLSVTQVLTQRLTPLSLK